jgi:hypothetical protein
MLNPAMVVDGLKRVTEDLSRLHSDLQHVDGHRNMKSLLQLVSESERMLKQADKLNTTLVQVVRAYIPQVESK